MRKIVKRGMALGLSLIAMSGNLGETVRKLKIVQTKPQNIAKKM